MRDIRRAGDVKSKSAQGGGDGGGGNDDQCRLFPFTTNNTAAKEPELTSLPEKKRGRHPQFFFGLVSCLVLP